MSSTTAIGEDLAALELLATPQPKRDKLADPAHHGLAAAVGKVLDAEGGTPLPISLDASPGSDSAGDYGGSTLLAGTGGGEGGSGGGGADSQSVTVRSSDTGRTQTSFGVRSAISSFTFSSPTSDIESDNQHSHPPPQRLFTAHMPQSTASLSTDADYDSAGASLRSSRTGDTSSGASAARQMLQSRNSRQQRRGHPGSMAGQLGRISQHSFAASSSSGSSSSAAKDVSSFPSLGQSESDKPLLPPHGSRRGRTSRHNSMNTNNNINDGDNVDDDTDGSDFAVSNESPSPSPSSNVAQILLGHTHGLPARPSPLRMRTHTGGSSAAGSATGANQGSASVEQQLGIRQRTQTGTSSLARHSAKSSSSQRHARKRTHTGMSSTLARSSSNNHSASSAIGIDIDIGGLVAEHEEAGNHGDIDSASSPTDDSAPHSLHSGVVDDYAEEEEEDDGDNDDNDDNDDQFNPSSPSSWERVSHESIPVDDYYYLDYTGGNAINTTATTAAALGDSDEMNESHFDNHNTSMEYERHISGHEFANAPNELLSENEQIHRSLALQYLQILDNAVRQDSHLQDGAGSTHTGDSGSILQTQMRGISPADLPSFDNTQSTPMSLELPTSHRNNSNQYHHHHYQRTSGFLRNIRRSIMGRFGAGSPYHEATIASAATAGAASDTRQFIPAAGSSPPLTTDNADNVGNDNGADNDNMGLHKMSTLTMIDAGRLSRDAQPASSSPVIASAQQPYPNERHLSLYSPQAIDAYSQALVQRQVSQASNAGQPSLAAQLATVNEGGVLIGRTSSELDIDLIAEANSQPQSRQPVHATTSFSSQQHHSDEITTAVQQTASARRGDDSNHVDGGSAASSSSSSSHDSMDENEPLFEYKFEAEPLPRGALLFLFGFILMPLWWCGAIYPKKPSTEVQAVWKRYNRMMSGLSMIILAVLIACLAWYAAKKSS
ncbi:hypothetical protein GQ42DRAFT_77723 [Ramicandelaber brevisporus]|nr:hypothetical protein GQ42DRAFT_77723 [Ramicandelaber brevisporus]